MIFSKKAYKTNNILSAIFMALTLLWLTISIPFVFAAQQNQIAFAKENHNKFPDTENSCNPFANTTEEKAPSSTNLSEEYLHHEEQMHFDACRLNHTHQHSYSVYVAFHGELLSPPPEA